MLRKLGFITMALLILLLNAALTVHAQTGAPWFVLLYDGNTRALTRVYNDGRQETYPLGLGDDVYISAREMAFNADASRVALCLVTYTPEGQVNTTRLIVRDIVGMVNVLEMDLPRHAGCRASVLDTERGILALGLVSHYFGDPAADPSRPAWEFQVLDLASGSVLQRMTPDMLPGVPLEFFPAEIPLLLVARLLDESGAVLLGYPFAGMGGMPVLPAYRWEFASGAVESVSGWGGFNADYLPATGELVYGAYNENLPVGEPGGPVPQNNVLTLQESNGQTRTIYHSPDWLILNSTFVNDGQQILLMELEPFDFNAPDETSEIRLRSLGRDGAVADLGRYPSFVDVQPVPGGFVVLWAEYPAGETGFRMMMDYYAGGRAGRLLEFGTDNTGVTQELAWTPALVPAADLPPFPAVMP